MLRANKSQIIPSSVHTIKLVNMIISQTHAIYMQYHIQVIDIQLVHIWMEQFKRCGFLQGLIIDYALKIIFAADQDKNTVKKLSSHLQHNFYQSIIHKYKNISKI